MKHTLVVACLLAAIGTLFSQAIESSTPTKKSLDSLKAVFQSHINKVEVAYQLAQAYRYLDADTAMLYARIALDQSDKNNVAAVLGLMGLIKRKTTEYDSSEYYYRRSIEIAQAIGNLPLQVNSLNDLGVMLEDRGKLTEALALYTEALRLSEAAADSIGIANAQLNVGFIYFAQDDFDQAEDWFNKSLKTSQAARYVKGEAWNYSNLAQVYSHQKKYSLAIEYQFKAASYISPEKNKREYSRVYNNVGQIYQAEGNLAKAKEFYEKAIALKKELNDPHDLASTVANLSNVQYAMGDAGTSLKTAKEALVYAKKGNALTLQLSALLSMAKASGALKNFSDAYQYQREAAAVQDSIFHESKLQKRAEMIAKYEVDKKEQENKLLKQQAELNQAKLERKNLWIVTTILGLSLVLAISGALYYINRKKEINNRLLTTQKEEIEKKNQQLQKLIIEKNSLMDIVAHDLRSPLNKVMGLAHLITYDGELSEAQQEHVRTTLEVTSQGHRLINDLLILGKAEEGSVSLNPELISTQDFIHGLLNEYQDIAQEKNIVLTVDEVDVADSFVCDRDVLTRILDNLISNAIKFSPMGKQVHVAVTQRNDNVIFRVRDSGPGFSEQDKQKLFQKFQKLSARPTNGEPSTGLGLAIVKQLIDQVNGTIELRSNKGQGAEFIVSLPIANGQSGT